MGLFILKMKSHYTYTHYIIEYYDILLTGNAKILDVSEKKVYLDTVT